MGTFMPTFFILGIACGVLLWSINWNKDSNGALCRSFYESELEYIRKIGKRLPNLPRFYAEWLNKTRTVEGAPLISKINKEIEEYNEWSNAIEMAKARVNT